LKEGYTEKQGSSREAKALGGRDFYCWEDPDEGGIVENKEDQLNE
jgi:hypothetical protein